MSNNYVDEASNNREYVLNKYLTPSELTDCEVSVVWCRLHYVALLAIC